MSKSLLSALLAAAIAIPVAATGQSLRLAPPSPARKAPTGNAVTFSRAQQKGVRLTPQQIKTIEAVTGPQRQTGPRPVVGGNRLSALRRAMTDPRRANASGSILEGWRSDYWDEASGWYHLNEDGSQELQWMFDGGTDDYGQKISFPFNIGFLRNGKVYGIGSTIFFSWALMEYGVFTRAGVVEEYTPCDELSDDLSRYVMSLAYDSKNDVAYAYTLNADGTAYMLQAIDPETWTYGVINDDVPLADICGAFAYNPVDGNLYGLTTDSRFVRVSPDDGAQETLRQYDMEPSSSVKPMIYSPYDNAFAFVVPDSYGEAKLCYIDAATYDYVQKADVLDTNQYPILICADALVQDAAPAVPAIGAITFEGGNLEGTATITMPDKTFEGKPLSGALTLVALTDGQEHARVEAQAGQATTVAIAADKQGRHTFRFLAEKDGLQGPGTEQTLYVGFDTPKAPENVELTQTAVTWDPVTEGTHGGYIDADALAYNVYIDGKLYTKQPVQGQSLDVTLPDGYYDTHVAQVEAVNHGLKSEKTYSNNVNAGRALPLPLDFIPTAKQAQLFTVISGSTSPYNRWQYANNGDDEQYFSVPTHSYTDQDATDEWLILPPVTIPQTDKLIEISWEARAQYEENAENLTVAYGATPDPEAMTVVEQFDGINNTEFAAMSTWAPIQPGEYYVAFKTRKSGKGNALALRQFYVDKSAITATSPARATGIKATALPNGQNGAVVEFDMPTLDVSGNALAADAQLEAKVECKAGKTTATGTPGSHQSVEIKTFTGWNDIAVTVSTGLPAATRVFTGLDIPAPITVLTVTTRADNLGMTLDWEAPTTGVNGGYVNPDEITYNVCLPGENGWEIAGDLGKARTVSLSTEAQKQGLAQVGILASNASGHSDTFRSTTQCLGTPYELPLEESFENYDWPMGPTYVEQVNDEYSENIGNYNFAWDDELEGGTYCQIMEPVYGAEHSYCRIVMPKVNLKGSKNPNVELRLYCGPDAGKIRLFAATYDMKEDVMIGEYECNDTTKHMQNVRIAIPDKFKDYDWTCLKLDAEFTSDQQRVGIESVRVADLADADLAVVAVEAPQFMLTSQPVTMTATVRNAGLAAMPTPKTTCQIAVGDRVIDTIEMECAAAGKEMQPMDRLTFQAAWTPDVEAGNGAITLTMIVDAADDNADNNAMATAATVCRGNQAIINDLTATAEGDDVKLEWTEPKAADGTESFENYAAFSYYSQLGDFTALDNDALETLHVNFALPDMGKPKAWQVFSTEEIDRLCDEALLGDNNWFHAHSGDKALVAVTPNSAFIGEGLQADDWLISPELVEGTDFGFSAASLLGGTEDIEVMTSAEPDYWTFETVKHVYPFGLDTWFDYTFTLPEGHKYFAIHYVGNSDNHQGAAIDDIKYVSAAPAADVVVGYDVLRDGAAIVECQPMAGSYADLAALATAANPFYNVVPVLQGAQGLYRGQASNTAHIGTVGIGQVAGNASASKVYDLMGRRVSQPARGIYIKVQDGKATKVRL